LILTTGVCPIVSRILAYLRPMDFPPDITRVPITCLLARRRLSVFRPRSITTARQRQCPIHPPRLYRTTGLTRVAITSACLAVGVTGYAVIRSRRRHTNGLAKYPQIVCATDPSDLLRAKTVFNMHRQRHSRNRPLVQPMRGWCVPRFGRAFDRSENQEDDRRAIRIPSSPSPALGLPARRVEALALTVPAAAPPPPATILACSLLMSLGRIISVMRGSLPNCVSSPVWRRRFSDSRSFHTSLPLTQ
jgi:hypothetical protein